MKLIIYNPSSFGGNFEYVKKLEAAICTLGKVDHSVIVAPKNAKLHTCIKVDYLLIRDKIEHPKKIVRQIHFIVRSCINPILLFFNLLFKYRGYHVLFNDFEQATSPLWAPLFCLLFERKIYYILHDPDRDKYFKWTWLSQLTMWITMLPANGGFYHGFLPQKPYYSKRKRFIEIPHGVYDLPKPDPEFVALLAEKQQFGNLLVSIPGNIRPEKNYEALIKMVASTQKVIGVVCGAPANVRVNTNYLKSLITKLNIGHRFIWVERYLSKPEMSALLYNSDVVLLNYSSSFSSQSGIVNLAAYVRKPVVISDTQSGLSALAKKFGFGNVIEADCEQCLIDFFKQVEEGTTTLNNNWDNYLIYAKWDVAANKIIDQYL